MSQIVFVRRPFVRQIISLVGVTSLALAPAMHAQGGTASITDPRVGLHPGLTDAGVAAKNMELVSHRPKPDIFDGLGGPRGLTFANSDLAFRGNYVFQGNFSGFSIWDVANPGRPVLRKALLCATGQGDPSIYGNLLFISSEGTGDRLDCGTQGVQDRVSKDRMVGVRIFDISDMDHPRQVADVQTCRGSHTHTLVPDPTDKGIVYVYVSGSAQPRSPDEMPGCLNYPIDSLNSALFRIEVIRVPLAHPEQAKIVNGARIFDALTAAKSHGNLPGDTLGRGGRGGRGNAFVGAFVEPLAPTASAVDSARFKKTTDSLRAAGVPIVFRATLAAGRGGGRGNGGPSQCHDITVYPAIGLAGGACGGYGLLLDIHDPVNPKRIDFVGDSNFAFWHSATFSNDGSKLLFTDEWGGGTAARCRVIDPLNWGADAIFSLKDGKLTQGAYFKMPAAQTEQENCVAHNGSLIPVPGRDIMVQGWYQGGIDVFDFTDPTHPREIAYFDRGPIPNHPERADSSATGIVTGGYWCGYWYNGHIYASEIARGFDIFDLTPSEWLSQNEIDAAKLVHWDQFNPQSQPRIVWPAAFPVARSYLDQLVRGDGLAAARTSEIAKELNSAEKTTGAARASALTRLAVQLDGDAENAADGARVRALAAAVRDLAKAAR